VAATILPVRGGHSPRPGAEPIAGGERRRALALALVAAAACSAEPIAIDGQYGRPLPLGSGDASPLPRLAFIDEGCPGELAAGGCEESGDRQCQMLLVDSLAPLTALRDPDASGSRLSVECLEVRPAAGLFAPAPSPADREAAVARFRFDALPLVRASADDGWSWTAGNQQRAIEPAGVLGGNLLRSFAVAIRTPTTDASGEVPTLTLFGEFPGSEAIMANQGRAFLPVQFPGRLLGRELSDRCEVDEGRCELDGFDVSTSAPPPALVASRMVMDACVAIPPCTLHYAPSRGDPFAPGTCELHRGPTSTAACIDPTDPRLGGRSASLVVATGVPGLVLFSDSAARMFGELSALTPCPTPLSPQTEIAGDLQACLIGHDGVLHFAGWPSAGQDAPLPRLRIRSLALVPGAAQSRTEGPCERADQRRNAMRLQCRRYVSNARVTGDIRDAAPPYSPQRDDADGDEHASDPGASALAVLGEPMLQAGANGPRPSRWITTTVLPADHPLALAVRRDVAPDAREIDGLLGTALFPGTETVLDYTDINPALRVTCLEPHEGRCQVLPDCRKDQSPACCHGLPRTMLDELIRTLGDDTCCGALSAADLAGLVPAGHCVGVAPP
jgi:hypothetical protein